MIEDTLKANPGMRETYRAYGKLQVCARHIEELEANLNALQTNGASETAIKDAVDRLAQLKARLREYHTEALQCLEREDVLRSNLGFPPLEKRVLDSAHESLKKYEGMFQELNATATV